MNAWKWLLVEYVAAACIVFVGLWWMNHEIDVMIVVPRIETPQTSSESLTVPDSADANSATDAIQTAAGTKLYQDAAGDIQ